MYELIKLNENDYYIDCPSKIGLVRISGNDFCAIDSGNDKDAGKKVQKVCEENGWLLKKIYSTHSHADHIGGNKLLQDRTGCRIFANKAEADVSNHTFFEPALLWGTFPPNDLTHKAFMAQESVVEMLDETCEMQILPLAGHSFDMVGYLTKDGTAFVGDALSSKATLQKYAIGFIWDVAKHLETLEYLKTVKANKFVPSHAEVTSDISELIEYNIASTKEVAEKVYSLCEVPTSYEQLLKQIFDIYNIGINAPQYVLIGSVLRAYISYLRNSGKIEYEFCDNVMLWKQSK